MEKSVSYKTILLKRLQDPNARLEYINEALKDEDPEVFLLALRNIIDAMNISISNLSKQTMLDRSGLHKILSHRGNPKFGSIKSILDSIGLDIQIAARN